MHAANPDTLQFTNVHERGLMALRVTRARVHCEYHFFSSVQRRRASHHVAACFDIDAGVRGKMRRAHRYMTVNGEIPARAHGKRIAFIQGVHDVSKGTGDG